MRYHVSSLDRAENKKNAPTNKPLALRKLASVLQRFDTREMGIRTGGNGDNREEHPVFILFPPVQELLDGYSHGGETLRV